MNERFIRQVELLISVLPSVKKEKCFALKGGTAINFFWRNVPRLSVDIDLVYLPIKSRQESLQEIDSALMRIKADLKNKLNKPSLIEKRISSGACFAMSVIQNDVLIKIEPNTVLRGHVFPTCERDVSSGVEMLLGIPAFVSMTCLSKAETYGGKIIAALDRQHPRDLFDVKLLFDADEFDNQTRMAFVIYLAGHNRPIHEVLNPQPINFQQTYENEFSGMTRIPITFDELFQARENLFGLIPEILTEKERKFLLSVKKGKPDWGLLPVKGIDKLPAIQWKLKNISMLDKNKHTRQFEALKRLLE